VILRVDMESISKQSSLVLINRNAWQVTIVIHWPTCSFLVAIWLDIISKHYVQMAVAFRVDSERPNIKQEL